jgi:hypothetical protein
MSTALHCTALHETWRLQVIFTSLLLCFGGGVLLATAMLHILPEVER